MNFCRTFEITKTMANKRKELALKKSKFRLNPMRDKIVVLQESEIGVTKGGIYLPDQAKEIPLIGEVLAVGSFPLTAQGDEIKQTLRVGDRIAFPRYAGNRFKLPDTEDDLLIMTYSDVLATVEEVG